MRGGERRLAQQAVPQYSAVKAFHGTTTGSLMLWLEDIR
jgi:hypothetical protein